MMKYTTISDSHVHSCFSHDGNDPVMMLCDYAMKMGLYGSFNGGITNAERKKLCKSYQGFFRGDKTSGRRVKRQAAFI